MSKYFAPLLYLVSSEIWHHNINSCMVNAPLSNLVSMDLAIAGFPSALISLGIIAVFLFVLLLCMYVYFYPVEYYCVLERA